MANWTDDPIVAYSTPRRVIHQTEIHEAIDERTIACNVGPGPGLRYAWDYDGPTKLWVPDGSYPIANPDHWPPNQDPDNKFRDDHINDCRTRSKELLTDLVINPDDTYYRPYDNSHFGTVDGVSFHPYQNGIGKVYYEDDPLATGPSTPYDRPRACHIEDLRNMLEHYVVFAVNRTGTGAQYFKSGDVWGKYTAKDAWDTAAAACLADSWSAYGCTDFDCAVGMWGALGEFMGTPPKYHAHVMVFRTTFTFNLDIWSVWHPHTLPPWNILPVIWAKLISPGYVTDAKECSADFTVSCFTKCVETGNSAVVPKIVAGQETRGYAICENIDTYVGSASVDFTYTAIDDFSLNEMAQIKPPVPAQGFTAERSARVLRQNFVGSSHQAGTGVVIKPDWHRPD